MSFLQIGPHYYPPNPMGAQVIMRGPHGMRMAADPVRSRSGRERGSGFRFWTEEMNVPTNTSWNPPQRVVGLMGVGDLPSDWRCPYSTRGDLGLAIQRLEFAVQRGQANHEEVRAEAERLRECHMQLSGQRSYTSQLTRINKVHQASMLKAGKVSGKLVAPGGGLKPYDDEYCRVPANRRTDACRDLYTARPDGSCSDYDLICKWKKGPGSWSLTGVIVGGVLVVGGLVFAANFAKGLGSGLTRRG